jgi:hypothetical protein
VESVFDAATDFDPLLHAALLAASIASTASNAILNHHEREAARCFFVEFSFVILSFTGGVMPSPVSLCVLRG